MAGKPWTDREVQVLCEMWNSGCFAKDIAKKLRKKRSAVTMYISRHREELGLGMRPNPTGNLVGRKKKKTIDELWHGVIPLGHWSITKPWGKKCDVKPVTKS